MALSGYFYTNVASNFRLSLEWSATQSISGNYSDVTTKLYWMSLSSSAVVYSSATKTASTTISGSSTTSSASAGLSGNQKKLIHTQTKRIYHNADGTASVSLDGWFDAEVTLNGQWVGRINLSAKTYTLNTIPRASTISTSVSFVAGNTLAIGVARASSSFTHKAKLEVQNSNGSWRLIKQTGTFGTSESMNFSVADITDIFLALAQRSRTVSRVTLETFSGSTKLGESVKTGYADAPSQSTVASGFDNNVFVDMGVTGGINRSMSSFTHTVEITLGNYTKTITGVTTSFNWTPTTAEQNSLYAQMPNDNRKTGNVIVTTYYNGVKVRGTTATSITFNVRNSDPVLSDSAVSFQDINSTTTALTGNNQYIVQNQSDFRATLSAAATAKNGASIRSYVISIAGQSKELTSTGSHTFGKIDASTNQTLTVRAVDSRGNTATVMKTVQMLPYQAPEVTLIAKRDNKFETTTRSEVIGTYSPLEIGGVKKNLIQSISYKYRAKGGTWSTSTGLTVSTNGTAFASNKFALEFDNTKAWELEVEVVDKFGNVTASAIISKGQPIFFIESEKGVVSINQFPRQANTRSFEVAGGVVVESGYFEVGTYDATYGTGFMQSFYDGNTNTWRLTARDKDYNGNDLNVRTTGDLVAAKDVIAEGTVRGSAGNINGRLDVNEIYSAGAMQGRLKHTNGYMEVQSFNSGYGNGQAELWYRADQRQLTVVSRNSGDSGSNAANLYVDTLLTSNLRTPSTGSYGYLQSGSAREWRVTEIGTTSTYRPIRAASFPTGSSINYKTNLEKADELSFKATDLINNTQVWKYHLQSNIDGGIFDKPKMGVITEMSDSIIRDEDGVDVYSMTALSWLAHQEKDARIVELENKVSSQEEMILALNMENNKQKALISDMLQRLEKLESASTDV
ncbi:MULTISPECIES: hypothetical protein [unclassified Exiguobacterium]|uniref:hypothetical protein n=1 Tax=unclassified Exiguobacterium TaxID=2644629 RepID=UPI001BE5D43A|nr:MULTISPECIES: hypothetical protein [unclassified Exiguobacterium]